MRLREFRLQGFRCIRDSGSVPVQDVTTLVGKNESGKTALLEALLLLNKGSEVSELDLCDEMTDELSNPQFVLVDGSFELTHEESELISKECPGIPETKTIRIYRCVDDREPRYSFPNITFPKPLKIVPSVRERVVELASQVLVYCPDGSERKLP